jgi:hypothetical protein
MVQKKAESPLQVHHQRLQRDNRLTRCPQTRPYQTQTVQTLAFAELPLDFVSFRCVLSLNPCLFCPRRLRRPTQRRPTQANATLFAVTQILPTPVGPVGQHSFRIMAIPLPVGLHCRLQGIAFVKAVPVQSLQPCVPVHHTDCHLRTKLHVGAHLATNNGSHMRLRNADDSVLDASGLPAVHLFLLTIQFLDDQQLTVLPSAQSAQPNFLLQFTDDAQVPCDHRSCFPIALRNTRGLTRRCFATARYALRAFSR